MIPRSPLSRNFSLWASLAGTADVWGGSSRVMACASGASEPSCMWVPPGPCGSTVRAGATPGVRGLPQSRLRAVRLRSRSPQSPPWSTSVRCSQARPGAGPGCASVSAQLRLPEPIRGVLDAGNGAARRAQQRTSAMRSPGDRLRSPSSTSSLASRHPPTYGSSPSDRAPVKPPPSRPPSARPALGTHRRSPVSFTAGQRAHPLPTHRCGCAGRSDGM